MSREYPDWVNPWKAAEGRRRFAGTMPIDRMSRLGTLLAGSDGECSFSAEFATDRQGQVIIDIAVEADVLLLCQRTLEPYWQQVKRSSRLGVIQDLADEQEMRDDYEPVLVEERRLSLHVIVEDELLLGLPQVPINPAANERFPASEAQAESLADAGSIAGEPVRQPFADLAEQLRRKASESDQDK